MVKVTKDEIQDAGNILALVKLSREFLIEIMATRVASGMGTELGDPQLASALIQFREIKATLETFVSKAKDLRHAKTYR